MFRYVFALALAICSPVVFADDALPQSFPPDREAAALKAAETIGLEIYRHDQAAAIATDAAIEFRQFNKDKRVRGWVTEELQDRIVVTFIDQTPAALYRISVSREGVAGPVVALEAPAPLTAYELGAATARAAAMASIVEPCSKKYNSVVLPSAGAPGANWVVYLLPGTTKHNIVPIGGTYRFDVHGSKVVSQRGFTRTCIVLQAPPPSGWSHDHALAGPDSHGGARVLELVGKEAHLRCNSAKWSHLDCRGQQDQAC